MAIVTTEPDAHEGGHHDSPEQRDHKERLALWLLIAGDAVFLLLEVFGWFYVRALNTNGMWRGAACTSNNPCTDGLGNPITHELAKADPWYSVAVALLAVVAALGFWRAESSARGGGERRAVAVAAGLAVLVIAAAVVVQCYQFTTLPFTTIDGTYASSFEFFMGSTLAHLLVIGFLGLGLWNRARLGRYGEGRWHQTRLMRIFAVWIAMSICVLVFVMSLFA
jgi:heme/copper-type cytochrome/quinol oxidase subunit 3